MVLRRRVQAEAGKNHRHYHDVVLGRRREAGVNFRDMQVVLNAAEEHYSVFRPESSDKCFGF